jgi:hypothetical protein
MRLAAAVRVTRRTKTALPQGAQHGAGKGARQASPGEAASDPLGCEGSSRE